MKEESTLDSAGPLTVIGLLAVVMIVATALMIQGQGGWGETETLPPVAAAPPADAEVVAGQ